LIAGGTRNVRAYGSDPSTCFQLPYDRRRDNVEGGDGTAETLPAAKNSASAHTIAAASGLR